MSALLGSTRQSISKAAKLIKNANFAVALTGAGYSTPSGIPDFRSETSGLWMEQNSLDVASLTSFRYNPNKFYSWFQPLAKLIFHAKPNSAHYALANMENAGFFNSIITQNIDLLHQKAGGKNVLEVHGSLQTLSCLSCFRKDEINRFLSAYLNDGTIPLCTHCGNTLKPDVVLIEEQLPIQTWLQAETAANQCDLMLIAGSSLVVMPVAGLPMKAIQNGASVILINQSPTYLDVRADVLIQEDVAEVLPLISQEVLGE